MKNWKYFFFYVILFAFGCSEDYKIIDSIESISIQVSQSTQIVGQPVSFIVKTNNGLDITNESTVKVNSTIINGSNFQSNVTGIFIFQATYQGVQSDPVLITYHDGSQLFFAKRVLIEDYTGTWCGNCPRVNYATELVKQQTDKAVIVGIHRSSSNPADANYDPYNFDTSELENIINISGYPKAMLNRMTRWLPLEQNNIPQVIALTQGVNPKLGLAINSSVTNNQIQLEVKTKFSQNFSNLRLVVYALENNLIYNQVNYTNFFNAQNPLINFEHDHVLKACLTPLLGEPIATSQTGLGMVFTKTFSWTPTAISNLANLEFVAFIVDENNKAINVRSALLNTNQTFEEY